MEAPLALAPLLEQTGGVLLAALAAAAVVAPSARTRAYSTLGALALAPALLVGQIHASAQFRPIARHPLVALVAGLVALGLLALAARWLRARPRWFPLVVVAALPFRIPIQSGGTTSNLLVPLYLVIATGALAFFIPRIRASDPEGHADLAPSGTALALIAFVGLYAVQALYSPAEKNAESQLVFFYVPFALLFALLREYEWTRRRALESLGVLTGLAVVLVGIGYVEYATKRVLLNPKVIDTNAFSDYFRVNSLFFDPNIYGRFLAIVMLGLTVVLLWNGSRRVGWACAALLAVLWGGLVLSFSQSSFVALLAGLAVLAARRWDARRTALAVGGVILAGAVFVVAAQGVLKLDLGSASSVNRGTSGRLNLVRGGLRQFGARPVLGFGSGSFAKVYRERHRGSRQTAVSASHTIPVTVAAEQGVVGLVAYLVLVVVTVRGLLRARPPDDPVNAFLLAAFVALVLHTLIYAAFLEDPTTWALLGIAAAYARVPSRPPARAPAVAVP